MLNILVPIAGKGQRFKDEGYKMPKPLIDVRGQTMLELALENLDAGPKVKYFFLCLEKDYNEHKAKFDSIADKYKADITLVKNTTEGAACTALLAKDFIDNTDELIITDCDHLTLDPSYLKSGIKTFRQNKASGGIFSFWNDSPKWSYLRISGGLVKEVVEKQVVSNFANTGTYYFKYGQDFVDAAERMITNNIRVNGEFYIAPTYNQLVLENKKVMPYFVNGMIALGTPSDLTKYLGELA